MLNYMTTRDACVGVGALEVGVNVSCFIAASVSCPNQHRTSLPILIQKRFIGSMSSCLNDYVLQWQRYSYICYGTMFVSMVCIVHTSYLRRRYFLQRTSTNLTRLANRYAAMGALKVISGALLLFFAPDCSCGDFTCYTPFWPWFILFVGLGYMTASLRTRRSAQYLAAIEETNTRNPLLHGAVAGTAYMPVAYAQQPQEQQPIMAVAVAQPCATPKEPMV
jgi:hypothetical protein